MTRNTDRYYVTTDRDGTPLSVFADGSFSYWIPDARLDLAVGTGL